MRSLSATALFACLLTAALVAPAASAQERSGGDRSGKEKLQEATEELAEQAGESASLLADRVNARLAQLVRRPAAAWTAVVALLGGGLALLLFGWAMMKALFLPLSSLIAAATATFLAGEIVLAMSPDSSSALQLGVPAVGAAGAIALNVVLARKARPLAWLMVVLAPFLVLSAFIFPLGPYGKLLAVVTVAVGLAVGFVSTVHHRLLVIVSNSLLGATCLVAGLAVLAQLTRIGAMLSALDWAIRVGWPLPLVVVVLAAAGVNLQLTFGPPAEPAGTDRAKRRSVTTVGRGG